MRSHDDNDSETSGSDETDYSEELELNTPDAGYIATEEKKPLSKATLILFAIFGAAGLGSYFLLVKSGPEAGAAETDPKASQVIEQYMTDKSQNMGTMKKMLRDTDAVVKQFLTYPSVTQVPLEDLRTNPFRMSGTPEPGSASTAKEAEREKKRKEDERQAVLRSVQNLQLQSVMSSDKNKSCMINNVLYTEGQQVDQFTVEKISPNAVIVRNAAFRFELKMQR